jgi:hypothetical protein
VTLRLRLLLAFAYLVALVLATAVSATLGFLYLASGIDRVLTENFATVTASVRMRSALDAMDRAALLARSPAGVPREVRGEPEAEFRRALAEAEANVTEVAEPAALNTLRAAFEAYALARTRFVESGSATTVDPGGGLAYESALAPPRGAVEDAILDLLTINEQAMFRAEAAAKRSAVRSATVLGALVALSLLSFVFMSGALHRDVLDRLDELREGVSLLGSGDRVRRLREHGGDELSVIAREVNRLLDRQQETESSARARVGRGHRLALGLLTRCGDGAAIFGTDGSLLAGSLEDPELHDAVGARLRESEPAAGPISLQPLPGARLRAEVLGHGPGSLDAWLVTTDPPAS